MCSIKVVENEKPQLEICYFTAYHCRQVGEIRVKLELWDTAGQERLGWIQLLTAAYHNINFVIELQQYSV